MTSHSESSETELRDKLVAKLRRGHLPRWGIEEEIGCSEAAADELIDALEAEGIVAVDVVTNRISMVARADRSDDHAMLHAEDQARDARLDPTLVRLREELLEGSTLGPEQVAGWIRQRAEQDEAAVYETRGRRSELCEVRSAVIQFLTAEGHLGQLVSTWNLEPLRKLSERFAIRYGWTAAEAVRFILTDEPVLLGTRIEAPTPDNHLPRYNGARTVQITCAVDEDPAVVAAELRRFQRENRGSLAIGTKGKAKGIKRPEVKDQRQQRRLAEHCWRHGKGAGAWDSWRTIAAVEGFSKFKTRQSFHAAATEALESAPVQVVAATQEP